MPLRLGDRRVRLVVGGLDADPDLLARCDVVAAAEHDLERPVVVAMVDDPVKDEAERPGCRRAVEVTREGRLRLGDEAVGLIGVQAPLHRHQPSGGDMAGADFEHRVIS
jgi:hypothetical protein